MHLKDKILSRPEVENDTSRDSLALPKFSFESDERPLVSTERLFRQWQEDEAPYDTGYACAERGESKEEDIIVCALLPPANQADEGSRLPGTDHTTPETP